MSQLQIYTLRPGGRSWLTTRNLRWWTLASGFALGFSFPPYGMTVLAWISLVPLFLSARFLPPRSAFVNAWFFYLGMFAVAFHWPLLHVRADTALVSATAWLAFTMVLAVPVGFSSWVSKRYSAVSSIWLTGLMILLVEFVLRSGPIPMPWTALGYSQASSGAVVRASFWMGSTGLSTALVIANASLAQGLLPEKRNRIRLIIASFSVPALVLALGLTKHSNETAEQKNIAVIQPGYSPDEWSDTHNESRVQKMIALSDSTIQSSSIQIDLVVWPETTLPIIDSRSEGHPLMKKLISWTESHSVSLLTGAITTTGESAGFGPPYYNSAILFAPGAAPSTRSKNILVPFAESVPLANLFSFLERFAVPAGGVAGYLPGGKPSVIASGGIHIGIIICFEIAFPQYASELKNNDSNLFIVLTQSGWWRGSAGYRQQIMYARFRAVEQGRTLVQASVDGISGIITPDAIVHDLTSIRTQATLVHRVSLYSASTFYGKFGDLWNWIVLGIWLSITLFYGVRQKHIASSLFAP